MLEFVIEQVNFLFVEKLLIMGSTKQTKNSLHVETADEVLDAVEESSIR